MFIRPLCAFAAVLALQGCSSTPKTASLGMKASEPVQALETIVRNAGEEDLNLGVKNYSESVLLTLEHIHLTSIEIRDDGSLQSFTVPGADPMVTGQDGRSFSWVKLDSSGRIVESEDAESSDGCHIQVEIIDGVTKYSCRADEDYRFPDECKLTAITFGGQIIHSCHCSYFASP